MSLGGLLGNASEVSRRDASKELTGILIPGEVVEKAFKLVRDMIIITSKRLIRVDKQGITGKKVEYLSIPWKSIFMFSTENAGNFDLDSELKIWIKGTEPISIRFAKGVGILDVQALIAKKIL